MKLKKWLTVKRTCTKYIKIGHVLINQKIKSEIN